ncbi:MAG: hypothetical protein A3H02_00210 [Candidatus Niyogibacteria bacterium RIFCSPLOWO2_12_FULL_41_13]|uniref:MBL fold hydrolase n=1 Tax=Candidatus Niyogibacteria bacterium RIFCSPLOWO2_12_FULL_41_13 TaxID=1801726 RepID=A0A1G2F4Q4_9BACT|nr:MAG: hypothetical protein A3H02_00210 [Candidatus Niyogibacteria bacterium RIFCSPLOWO2_12_FULL_41_13]
MKIHFYGASQEVTGSCFLLENKQAKFLIDCGLWQCARLCERQNHDPFPFNPKEIEAVFVTHSHIDHIGRIPKLVKDGFQGKIYSTEPTRDLSKIMLEDSQSLMKREAEEQKIAPLYKMEDVKKALTLWKSAEYGEKIAFPDFEFRFLEAGHILGSAMVEVLHGGKKVVFTGDLGNKSSDLLKPPEKIQDANFLIADSLYGDSLHEGVSERKIKLERVIEDTMNKKGVLMIPAFSLERTQELLFEINNLIERGRVPRFPAFIDSPLAIKALDVYKQHSRYFNLDVKSQMKIDDIFNFSGLTLTPSVEESKKINDVPSPKIILAGSGMSEGGRILFHEERYLSDPNSTLLIVSYQAVGSLGRRLKEGIKKIVIHGKIIDVRARIESISGFSAHADYNELFEFIEQAKDNLEKVFLIHSEPRASFFLAQLIRDNLGREVVIPKYGDVFEI